MLQIDAKVEGGARLQRALSVLSEAQTKKATSEGINMAANGLAKAMRSEMRRVFDHPTGYILNSIWVDRATPEKLSAWVAPTYEGRHTNRKGIDPQKILRAQEAGGGRRDKRIEVALRQAGLLPNGMQISIPDEMYGGPLEGSADSYGNLRGTFLRKLLVYLKTNWADVETAKKRQSNALLKRYEWQTHFKTKRVFKLMDGREFFVSDGQGRSRLGPGVWARQGRELRCAIAFVKTVEYRTPRINLDAIRQKSNIEQKAAKWIRGRIYEAARQAGG